MAKKLTGTEGVDGGEIEDRDYVICQICEKHLKLLDSHLPRAHNITKEEYLKLYPNARMICDVSIQHRKDAQDKINKTNLERYGVERPTQSQVFRDKVKATNIEKFGADHPMKTEASKDKYKKTSMENYGVDHPWKSEEVQDEIKKRNLRDYGVEYLLESDVIQAKIRKTNLERYGSEWLFGTKFFQDKRTETLLDRYGVEHPAQNDIIYDKIKNTNIERYGGVSPFNSEIIREKSKLTNIKIYGFEYPPQSDIIKEHYKLISLAHYGVDHPWKSKEIRDKIKETNLEKYGFEYATQAESVKIKIREARLKQVFPVKDTSIEIKIQNILNDNNYIFITHKPCCGICQPDIMFPAEKIIIQCDGDYWHDYPNGLDRDHNQDKILRENGWTVLRFWEHEINNDIEECLNKFELIYMECDINGK